MSKKTSKKAVAKKESQELATGFDFMEDVGGGMEGTDKDSFAIPFLRVLQKISPQCDEADAAYVEGAKGGMLYNSVTGELFDGKEGVLFTPCAFQRRFLRWAPRGSDAGFKGELKPEDAAEMRADGRAVDTEDGLLIPTEDGELSAKKCDRLVDTRSHFGLVIGDEKISQVVLPLTSTQIKKSKQLMSMLNEAKVQGPNGLVTPPTWMNKMRITTVLESNDQGSWYGVRFAAEGFIEDKTLYDAGKSFHAAITAGEAKANFAEEEGGAAAPAATDDKF